MLATRHNAIVFCFADRRRRELSALGGELIPARGARDLNVVTNKTAS